MGSPSLVCGGRPGCGLLASPVSGPHSDHRGHYFPSEHPVRRVRSDAWRTLGVRGGPLPLPLPNETTPCPAEWTAIVFPWFPPRHHSAHVVEGPSEWTRHCGSLRGQPPFSPLPLHTAHLAARGVARYMRCHPYLQLLSSPVAISPTALAAACIQPPLPPLPPISVSVTHLLREAELIPLGLPIS